MKASNLSDEELIAQARLAPDSPQAASCLNELFGRYHVRTATWCLRLAGDRQSAADLAQEVLMKAYKNLDSFHGNARFSTWLYSIARNHCINYLKSASRLRLEFNDERLQEVPDGNAESAFEEIEKAGTAAWLREFLSEVLDETERRVMFLHYGEEMPLGSVTRLLGLGNPSGAKVYIVSAKRKLMRAAERRKIL